MLIGFSFVVYELINVLLWNKYFMNYYFILMNKMSAEEVKRLGFYC